ncbi:uncharacterized protein METZ01_LOCUS354362, partial [marine metagenome]
MLKRIIIHTVFMVIASLMIVPDAISQNNKIGYVDLERIRQTYKGFKDAQSQFQKSVKDSQDKVRMMEEEVASMKQRYEARKMMLTDTKRQED